MLARSFRTAAELGISEIERSALISTLGALERGEVSGFDMERFRHDCGSPACICGWANHLSAGMAFPELRYMHAQCEIAHLLYKRLPKELVRLFDIGYCDHANATTQQAAQALSSYLTTGETVWPS